MSKQERISLIVTSDNQYSILLAALLKSVEQNHKTEELLDVYILEDKISFKNRSQVQATINPEITTLHWINIKDVIPADVKFPIDNTAFPLTCLYRIFAPHALPANLGRVIYLDADMIVLEDISKLWHTDIGNNTIAAVKDVISTVSCAWGGISNYKELGIPADTKYFNSGLLLIDMKRWRAEDVTEKVLNFMHQNIEFLNYPDQYGLNGVLYKTWYELDERWNWFAQFKHSAPYIIHFLHVKPIFKDPYQTKFLKTSYCALPEFKAEFYRYLVLTPWKNYKPVSYYNLLLKKAYTKAKKKFLKVF